MKDGLIRNIAKHITLSDSELAEFTDLFQSKFFKKKEFLLKEGELCTFEAFVTKGLLRVYHVDRNDSEQALYFAAEDWWISDIDSFTNEKPSDLNIEVIEDSDILLISKADKEYAYKAGCDSKLRSVSLSLR